MIEFCKLIWCGLVGLLRSRASLSDGAYGEIFVRRARSIGIRDRPTSARSLWQNAYVERLIGSIRRECVDHIVVFGERHLHHVLLSYMHYYNDTRTHLALNKDVPYRAPPRQPDTLFAVQSWVDYTTNMFAFDLR